MLYFAYGSNLDIDNWAQWCASRGFAPDSIEPLGPAWLPDYEPVFHYKSRLRNGGALDVRRRIGTATPGALFRVHDWAGLDAKEGVTGGFYRRIEVTALTDDGEAHAAVTYTVSDHRVGSFVAPSPEYRDIVIRGLRRFDHSYDQFIAASDNRESVALPTSIFAYGTLMTGERSHGLIEPRILTTHRPARLSGAGLVRIDWYPGLILGREGEVEGELYEVDDVAGALQELDPYEDFEGYEHHGSLYRRSLVRVRTALGPALAWTYVFLGNAELHPAIPSGTWRHS